MSDFDPVLLTAPCGAWLYSLCPGKHQPWHKQPGMSARAKIYFHFKQSPEINK